MFLILFKFYIQFLIIQGELERNLKWLIKEYCFMKLNFRIFSDTTMSFGRLRETIFFPLGAWCVCIILVAFPSKFSKRDAIFDLELPMNFWQ